MNLLVINLLGSKGLFLVKELLCGLILADNNILKMHVFKGNTLILIRFGYIFVFRGIFRLTVCS